MYHDFVSVVYRQRIGSVSMKARADTVTRACIDVYRVRIERERIGYIALHVYRVCIRRVSDTAS